MGHAAPLGVCCPGVTTGQSDTASGGMGRVLVVDDSPGVTLALKVAFRMDGRFEIGGSAATAAEGLQKLPAQDAVLLDLHLPDMGGPELVRAFRERGSGIPVILHSASDDTPEVEAVREEVDAVVLKSRVDHLLATLSRLAPR
jgi:DNA-binding NarL/FixJ family response regulator